MEVEGSAEAAPPQGKSVMTVTGPIDPQQVCGPGLCSEHLLYDFSPFVPAATDHDNQPVRMAAVSLPVLGQLFEDPFSCIDNLVMKAEPSAEEELRAFAKHGGSIVVDTTVTALGRNPRALRRLAQATGVQIVMGCGYFRSNTHPAHLASESAADIAKKIELELVGGAVDSDADARIYPGVIGALGFSATIDEAERKVLAGAAKAQAATGAPLFLDLLCCPAQALAVLDMVQASGGDVKKTVLLGLGPMCEEHAFLVAVLERGCLLGFDCVGTGAFIPEFDAQLPSDDRIAAGLERLVGAGYSSQVMLSHGHCLKMQRAASGGAGMGHLLSRFVPRLKRRGFAPDVISKLVGDNLRGLLTYYQPREVEAAPEVTWTCDDCAKSFGESKEKFEKFEFQFCSIKCLQSKRKKTSNWTQGR